MNTQIDMMKLLIVKKHSNKKAVSGSIIYGLLVDINAAFELCYAAMNNESVMRRVSFSYLEEITGFDNDTVVSAVSVLMETNNIKYQIDSDSPDVCIFTIVVKEPVVEIVVYKDAPDAGTEVAVKDGVPKVRKREKAEYPQDFLDLIAAYPKRKTPLNKKMTYKAWSARLVQGTSKEDLMKATKNYFNETIEKHGTDFVMMASTFYGSNERFTEFLVIDEGEVGGSTSIPTDKRAFNGLEKASETGKDESEKKAAAMRKLESAK